MKNTAALLNQAIVRRASEPTVLDTNGIAARLAISTVSDVHQATMDGALIRLHCRPY
jgi:hypothetical protein